MASYTLVALRSVLTVLLTASIGSYARVRGILTESGVKTLEKLVAAQEKIIAEGFTARDAKIASQSSLIKELRAELAFAAGARALLETEITELRDNITAFKTLGELGPVAGGCGADCSAEIESGAGAKANGINVRGTSITFETSECAATDLCALAQTIEAIAQKFTGA